MPHKDTWLCYTRTLSCATQWSKATIKWQITADCVWAADNTLSLSYTLHAHWSRSYYILNFAGLLLSHVTYEGKMFCGTTLDSSGRTYCTSVIKWLDRAHSAYVYLPVACSKRRSKWDYMVRETLHAGMPWVEAKKEQNKARLWVIQTITVHVIYAVSTHS